MSCNTRRLPTKRWNHRVMWEFLWIVVIISVVSAAITMFLSFLGLPINMAADAFTTVFYPMSGAWILMTWKQTKEDHGIAFKQKPETLKKGKRKAKSGNVLMKPLSG